MLCPERPSQLRNVGTLRQTRALAMWSRPFVVNKRSIVLIFYGLAAAAFAAKLIAAVRQHRRCARAMRQRGTR